MPVVVNTNEIQARYDKLGWDNLSLAETSEWLLESGINPSGLVAYLDALAAAPTGLDTDAIAGSIQGEVPYITDWLRKHGVVV